MEMKEDGRKIGKHEKRATFKQHLESKDIKERIPHSAGLCI